MTFKAQEIYQELLESCPNDTHTVKRLVSLFRHNDMVNDAIFVLNKYLEVNGMDEDAWLELCDIYLSRQNFSKAQFCMEELITADPQKYKYNMQYGEILYSQAIATNSSISMLELARKYFSHALVLIDNNEKDAKTINTNVVRALWGLLKTCKAIVKVQGPKDKGDEKNTQVLEIAQERLKALYSKNTNMDISSMNAMQQ